MRFQYAAIRRKRVQCTFRTSWTNALHKQNVKYFVGVARNFEIDSKHSEIFLKLRILPMNEILKYAASCWAFSLKMCLPYIPNLNSCTKNQLCSNEYQMWTILPMTSICWIFYAVWLLLQFWVISTANRVDNCMRGEKVFELTQAHCMNNGSFNCRQKPAKWI